MSRLYNIFFFNDTATTEIYTLSLHDALPICIRKPRMRRRQKSLRPRVIVETQERDADVVVRGFDVRRELQRAPRVLQRLRSEEHTSELQSRQYLVCRLLLEKKKNKCIL